AWGWASPLTIGLLIAAGVLLAAWIVVELRAKQPLVDIRMMRLPGVWNTNLAAILLGAAMFGVWAYFARFLQEPASTGYGLGASVGAAGLTMLPMLVLMAVAGFFTGPLTRLVSLRTQFAGGAALIALSTVSFAIFHTAVWQLAIAAGLFGLGLGIAYAAMTNIVVQSVAPTETGVASGMNANLRTIGSAIGTTLATAIVTGSAVGGATGGTTGEPTEGGYALAFLVLAGLAALASLAALVSRGRRAVETPQTEPEEALVLATEAELEAA
ncbi:MAG: MFS transporter, partial [Microbacteriaceae bacterium]|nr:MFS transporter [Microbacteriaceae bacterium]